MSHRLERRCPKAEMDDILGVLVQNWQGCLLWAFPILFWMIGSTRDWLECLLEFKLPSTGSEVLLCQQNVRSDSRSCKDSQLRPFSCQNLETNLCTIDQSPSSAGWWCEFTPVLYTVYTVCICTYIYSIIHIFKRFWTTRQLHHGNLEILRRVREYEQDSNRLDVPTLVYQTSRLRQPVETAVFLMRFSTTRCS